MTWDDTEWEAFTRECIALRQDREYHTLRNASGAGDRGVDVAAFLGSGGFDDGWDAYQCKYYAAVLHPGDAIVEIAKLLRAIAEEVWPAPREYVFVAPRGCGPSLSQLLMNATELRKRFLRDINEKNVAVDAEDKRLLLEQAEAIDFGIFTELDPSELLEIYKASPNYLSRFGGALPTPPEVGPLPLSPSEDELNYLTALYEAYSERHGGEFDFDRCGEVPSVKQHISRQREAFYSAESLERFVRDLVPPGTFGRFRDDIYDGVIETHESEWPDGMTRLTAVLQASQSLALNNSAILQAQRPKDRAGICHQLAGDGRLRWVRVPDASAE